jgi:hypothetical protein
MGRWALGAATVTEEERRSVVAERLPSHAWPASLLLIVAVDAETGAQDIRPLLWGKPGRLGQCKLRRAGGMASGHDRRPPLYGWRDTFLG